jgi:hypothetical protein
VYVPIAVGEKTPDGSTPVPLQVPPEGEKPAIATGPPFEQVVILNPASTVGSVNELLHPRYQMLNIRRHQLRKCCSWY